MNDTFKTVAVALITAIVVMVGYGILVGDNQLGAGTRFPNGISADSTSPSAGQVRGTTLTTTGAATLASLSVTGDTTLTGELLGSLLTQGGATTSSSTAVSFTLTAANVCDNAVYEMTPTIGAITVTFPTAAQLVADCIPNIGDSRTIWMHNASTTGGAITFADGSGGIHLEGEGLTTVMDFTEWAEITMLNVDGARYVLDVEIRQDAD